MILIINLCREKLHYYEFVKPIGEILSEQNWKIKHYNNVKEEDIRNADKIIICGTSLKDNHFTKHLDKFSWIKEIDKPILGICAGMQIIALTYKAKLSKKTEIGFYKEQFKENFLGLNEENEVYHLHNYHASLPKEFKSFTKSKIPQAIKHKTRNIYGVLFHPEVRNKKLIENFCKVI
jgi:GMP synthase-like glutamine amidotransferase